MISRRSILSLFGSIPFAGKAIAEETANLVGIRGVTTSSHLFSPYTGLVDHALESLNEPVQTYEENRDYYTSIGSFLKSFYIPKFRKEQIEKDLIVDKLDVDLASLRSISLSYAYSVQKKRNLEKELNNVRFNIRHEKHSREFYKKHGFHI